jgi:DNA-binding FadR family transcriptional regulator
METNMMDATSARLALAALATAAGATNAATPAAAAAPAAGALWARREPGPAEPRPYQLVAERICELVRHTGIKPGQRLPSERELSTTLAVSRPSLREAMIALELSGIIEVRHGSGVYLCEPPQKAARVPEAGPGPFELLSARRLIEPELAAMAARMATDGAIDTILVAAADMERFHDDKSSCELADRNFHLSIARATGNSALAGVLEYLWNQRGSLWHTLEELYETDELRKQTLDDHRRIVGAIAGRNPTAARQAMRAHLERVARTLSRS